MRPQPFEHLAQEQADRLRSYWEAAEVTVEGDPAAAEGLRFGLFQLLQSAPRDGRSNIPAKGLSGKATRVITSGTPRSTWPPFSSTPIRPGPRPARLPLLDPRWRPTARAGHGAEPGCPYPWRTIAGRECSAYYPSGSAQYHINADIAYAYWRYFEATGDVDFLVRTGAEVLFETARTWLEIGHFASGQFRIESVTGPDEYTCLVDNNYYTNAMARFHLSKAVEVRALLREREPRAMAELESRISLGDEEVESWARAARSMYLPHDSKRDLTPQDDGFLKKAPWDLATTPASGHPLLLHYHHLAIIRRQVCKQADAVLAHFLLPDVAAASTVKNSYLYYERITTHDSSLSYAVFSAMAARLGDVEKAHRYFNETVRLDLDDVQGNAKDGIHAANMGGAWLALVFGFGGFRPLGDAIAVNPVLPAAWGGISFRIAYRGRSLRVSARRALDGSVATTVELVAGEPIEVKRAGRRLLLSASSPLD